MGLRDKQERYRVQTRPRKGISSRRSPRCLMRGLMTSQCAQRSSMISCNDTSAHTQHSNSGKPNEDRLRGE